MFPLDGSPPNLTPRYFWNTGFRTYCTTSTPRQDLFVLKNGTVVKAEGKSVKARIIRSCSKISPLVQHNILKLLENTAAVQRVSSGR